MTLKSNLKTVPLNIAQASIHHHNELWMVDLSVHRPGVNLAQLKANTNVRALYLKATEGAKYLDPTAVPYAAEGKAAGLAVGAYMWPWPVWKDREVKSLPQVKSFAKFCTENLNQSLLPPMMDIEGGNAKPAIAKLGRAGARAWFERALREADTMLPQCGIYTTAGTIRELGGFNACSDLGWFVRPLWVAFYESPLPRLPRDEPPKWDINWLFWQMTSKGVIDGYPKGVDFNVINRQTDLYNLLK